MSRAEPRWIGELMKSLRIAPGSKVDLPEDFDPGYTADFVEKEDAQRLMVEGVQLLSTYQERLAAQDTHGVLLCLQGLDAAGKDSTIRHVMSGVNPQGVQVHGFKVPSDEELSHDYLWRYASRLPARGNIGIFNRSHYEEVLVVRVHPELLDRQRLPHEAKGSGIWKRRFAQINDWEDYLSDNGIRVLKVVLNISNEEQRLRFLRRIDLPDHHWKFSASDVRERRYWDDYQHAFSDMLSHTSSTWAPWYVVPADHKWFARVCVGAILVHTLIHLDPRFPEATDEQRRQLLEARTELMAQAPPGVPPDPFAAAQTE